MALIRLINTKTLKLEDHWDSRLPGNGYAILSHCWSQNPSDEVSYNDMVSSKDVSEKKGYAKLKAFCELARSLGYEGAWMDTVCINKDSATELGTALVSMYRWYAEAGICITYLEQTDKGGKSLEEDRWFTPGWTLQELIAPKSNMSFYDRDWELIGRKSDLLERLSARTKIPKSILNHDARLSSYSIAQRMSWAANRQTSRIEDRAYSLLGLFDVSLEMVYGERERAFLRLQERIMQHSSDQTIFAWQIDQESPPAGLLASSPDAFASSHDLVPTDTTAAFASGNTGITLELPTFPHSIDVYIVYLRCRHLRSNAGATILLAKLPDQHQFARVAYPGGWNIYCLPFGMEEWPGAITRRVCVRQSQDTPFNTPIRFRRTNGFWFRHLEPPFNEVSSYKILSRSGPATGSRVFPNTGFVGLAGIVQYSHQRAWSLWPSILWILVGFDHEFRPVITIGEDYRWRVVPSDASEKF